MNKVSRSLNLLVTIFIVLAVCAGAIFMRASQSNDATEQADQAYLNRIEHTLKMLEGAKAQWTIENFKAHHDGVSISDLTGYLPYNTFSQNATREYYSASTTKELIQAHLPEGMTLNGRPGPFTITSFDP